jgi:MFS family permease
MSPATLLFVALLNSVLGLSVLFPILAPLGRELRLSEVQVGLLSTAYSLMQLLLSPYWGKRSERVGRKRTLLGGVLGFGAGFLAFGALAELGRFGLVSGASLFALLVATRAATGIFSAATVPSAQAYMADITGPEQRVRGMALIGAAFGLGIVLGPAIGAALAHWSLLAPVYFSSFAAFVNALFIWRRLPEPARHVTAERWGGVSSIAARTWPVLAVGLAATLASVAMEQTIAFTFQDRLRLDATHTATFVGMALTCYGVASVAAQGFVVRRWKAPPQALFQTGLPLAGVGFVILVFAPDFPALTGGLALQGLGQGLLMPGVAASLSLQVGEAEQGAAAGLNGSVQALARTLGPILGTTLYAADPQLPYVFSAALAAVALLAARLTAPRRPGP